MSAVGHYLEEGGIPTASISLVREHTEAMAPPRALWVPFILGRPLGAPHDAAFQRQVLRTLLALFESDSGPVLRDFALDAPQPDPADPPDGAACPVNFARPRPPSMDGDELAAKLADELDELRPWHDLAVRRRGGSAVGLSGLTPERAGAFLCAFAADLPLGGFRLQQPLAMALKRAADAGPRPERRSAANEPSREPLAGSARPVLHVAAGDHPVEGACEVAGHVGRHSAGRVQHGPGTKACPQEREAITRGQWVPAMFLHLLALPEERDRPGVLLGRVVLRLPPGTRQGGLPHAARRCSLSARDRARRAVGALNRGKALLSHRPLRHGQMRRFWSPSTVANADCTHRSAEARRIGARPYCARS